MEGMKLARGYISPYFITDEKTQKCVSSFLSVWSYVKAKKGCWAEYALFFSGARESHHPHSREEGFRHELVVESSRGSCESNAFP